MGSKNHFFIGSIFGFYVAPQSIIELFDSTSVFGSAEGTLLGAYFDGISELHERERERACLQEMSEVMLVYHLYLMNVKYVEMDFACSTAPHMLGGGVGSGWLFKKEKW